jgi:cytochrome c551/c552
MSLIKFAVPAVVLIAGVAATSITSYAKPEYVKATKKACAYCHVGDAKVKPAVLTAAGEYYKKNKSLDGYVDKK